MGFTLTLGTLTLAAFGILLPGVPVFHGFVPTPAVLSALHLYTLGFLVPVLLSAVSLLSASVFLREDPPRRDLGALALPVSWLGGVGVAFGFTHSLHLLPWAAMLLMVASLAVLGSATSRILHGPLPTRELGFGIVLGILGLLATLGLGVLLGVAYSGLRPWPLPVLSHVALAAGAAFVPMLMAVSQQVFPMFAHCPPAPSALYRTAPAAVEALGTALVVLGVATASLPVRDAGAVLGAAALTAWFLIQERMYARRQGRTRDPAAWGARVAASLSVLGGWALAAGLVGTRPQGVRDPLAWIPAGMALLLVGGIGGAVVAYLRRILPFVLWNVLFRRFGRVEFLPKLDRLRPRIPIEILPGLWAFGSLALAFDLLSVPTTALWGGSYDLWPLACACWLGTVELAWAPWVTGWIWATHRREPHWTAISPTPHV